MIYNAHSRIPKAVENIIAHNYQYMIDLKLHSKPEISQKDTDIMNNLWHGRIILYYTEDTITKATILLLTGHASSVHPTY